MTIPTLETERLILRAPGMADFEGFAAFLTTERSRLVGGPVDRMEAWRYFAANLGQWQLRGYGMWMVEERATAAAAAIVGLFHPEAWITRELAWIVTDPAAEGRGIACEAAAAARRHAYRALGWAELFSVIDPGNARSIALARRLGCTIDRRAAVMGGIPVDVWRHPAPEALR